jgi:hypothetical protein
MGGTISDWIEIARRTKVDLSGLDTKKREDMERLRNSGLPQFDSFDLPYSEFTKDNKELMMFIRKNERVTIRALPKESGKAKGFTREYEIGWPCSYDSCRGFLNEVIAGNVDDYDVGMTSWEYNHYGFVLISSPKFVFGELGKRLDNLSHGLEVPLASFVVDRSGVGHLEDKTRWIKARNKKSASKLLEALKHIKEPSDNFNPSFLEGYFEGVITKSGVKFLDYKVNQAYLL